MSDPKKYAVGWICGTTTALTAARTFLDEEHPPPEYISPHSNGVYSLGRMGQHNIVISALPEGSFGSVPAALVANNMMHDFPNIRIFLSVGICGGAPSSKHDIRLGDVVVSTPSAGFGGVLPYDFGKAIQGRSFQRTGFLNYPPHILRTAVEDVKSQYKSGGNRIDQNVLARIQKNPRLQRKYSRPAQISDRLYRSHIRHLSDDKKDCVLACGSDTTCLVPRNPRTGEDDITIIHHGLIASANQIMRDALLRDTIISEADVLCFETEAAGLMNDFPCLVICGICDYADSHPNTEWQGYAAMAAAAYASDILSKIPLFQSERDGYGLEVPQEPPARDLGKTTESFNQITYQGNSQNMGEVQFDSKQQIFGKFGSYLDRHEGSGVNDPNKSRLGPGVTLHNTSHASDHEDLESTVSYSESDSVFSVPVSVASTRTMFESGMGAIGPLLVREFAALLLENDMIPALVSNAVLKDRIGLERMRNNFRRLLKNFAANLRAETITDLHKELRTFVSSYSAMITHEFFHMTSLNDKGNAQFPLSEAKKSNASVDQPLAHERKVEDYLESLSRSHPVPRAIDPSKDLGLDADSDQESVSEASGDDEPYEGSLQYLYQIKRFVLGSQAYQVFLNQLREFVQPSFYSQLRRMVSRYSGSNDPHGDISRYKLRNLITELQDVNPTDIHFEIADGDISRIRRTIGHYQHAVECWSGEKWDWWPFPHYPRPLKESETRLWWKSACGEERWAEVPKRFGQRIRSAIETLTMSTMATQHINPPPKAHISPDLSSGSTLGSTQTSSQAHQQYHGSQNQNASPAGTSLQGQIPGDGVNALGPNFDSRHVLFIVNHGGDYKLAQLRVERDNSRSFFQKMKQEYFHLRGFFRGWFGIWRFDHCDFYKFEKFGDQEFAIRYKDSFPDHANTDYEFLPKPMDNIPPICEREFKTRFYTCYEPHSFLHFYHDCKKSTSYSSDVLKSLPKKRTELEQSGDRREEFWGIYVREEVSVRWILFYNFVCISPLIIFFLVWIVPQDHGTDMQNPSVPLSLMISMLSLFWSIFLSSFQYNKRH